LAGVDETIGSLAGAGNVTNSSSAGSSLAFGRDNTDTSFSGVISSNGNGPVAAFKDGTGTMALNHPGGGAIDAANGFTIGVGVVREDASDQIVNSTAVTIGPHATLALSADVTQSLATTTFEQGGAITTAGNGYIQPGPINLTGAGPGITATITGRLQAGGHGWEVDGAGSPGEVDLDVSAVVFGLSIIKNRPGTLRLSGANTFASGTALLQGTLLIGNDSALGIGLLDMLGAGTTIQADGGPRIVSNQVQLDFASFAQGVVDGPNDLTLNGGVGGTGGLLKNGSGMLTLAAVNGYSGVTTVNAGGLAVNGSIGGGVIVNGGTLKGVGTIGGATVNSGGAISPGNSPGVLTVGSLTLNSGATTNIELGGTTRGSQYDALVVTGSGALNGSLNVSLINGFKPVTGNSFDILDWGSLSGTFANLQLPDLGGRIVWDSSQLYTTGTLSVLATYYAGDINRDGRVDVADISALENALTDLGAYQSTHGPGGGALTQQQLLRIADLNGDGLVTNADLQGLISLLANGGGSGGGTLTAVPEPSGVVLAGIAALTVSTLRGRRRDRPSIPLSA
jgi:autotransporter-associated beta strand protein